MIADEEQIAVRVGRADGVARGNAVERQHDRRTHIRAVAESGLGALDAQHHMRKAQQRLLDRLAQLVRAHPVLHADGVARHAGHGLVRVVKENLRVAVRAQARIVHHIHSQALPANILSLFFLSVFSSFSVAPEKGFVNHSVSNLYSIIHIINALYGKSLYILSVMSTVFGILPTLSPLVIARRVQI